MRKGIAIGLILAVLSFLALPMAVVAQDDGVPALPHQFYGTLKIRSTTTGTNVDAPVGTVVTAKVGGVEKGEIVVTTRGKYGGPTLAEGKLVVSDVEAEGSPIIFEVNGDQADTPAGGWPEFESGAIDELNLTAYAPSPPAGGGGIAPPGTIETDLFGIEGSFPIDANGKILRTITATSDDGNLTIIIPDGTILLDENGDPLESIWADIDPDPPDLPEGATFVGLPYAFGPDGATFDPYIIFEWTYDEDDIPEGVAEEDLQLAYFDGEEWVVITPPDFEINTDTNTITVHITHFTTFAILAAIEAPTPAPAAFSLRNLAVQPAEVQPNQMVTITVSVANTGGTAGSYTVALKINEIKEEEKSVTVAAGASEVVTFSVTKAALGSYNVTVDGMSASFTVVAPKEAVPPTPPPPTPEEKVVPPINWTLIGGIIAAVVVVALLIFFLARRRAV